MLTLANARKALWQYGSSVPYATATITDIGQFDLKLNEVIERFFTVGTWRSMWRRLTLQVFGFTLTLPRGFDTCRAIDPMDGGNPVPIYSQFSQFIGYGDIGLDSAAQMYRGLHLMSETAQTFSVPTGTYYLRAVGTEIAATGLQLTGGADALGDEIFGSTNLALINGATTGAQAYTDMPLIEKAVTNNAVSLYAVDTTTAVATLIANYAPGETIPAYRQYSVGGGLDTQLMRCLCKLAFVPAVASSDLIIPGNIGALKLGLMAIAYEDKTDPANAALYFGPNHPEQTGKMAGAIDLLDAEIAELEAAERPAFLVDSHFGAGTIMQVH